MEGAFAAALVVDKKGIAVTEKDVSGLEVAVEEIVARGGEEKIGETAEIVFEGALVEGDAGEAEEIILEIVEVPGDGLAVEAGVRVADGIIEITAGFYLEAREDGDDFAVGFDGLGGDGGGGAIPCEEFVERGVAEVFFEIGAVVEIFGVDFRDREGMAAKMFGEFHEGEVFFADAVEDADGAVLFGGEAEDFAARAAEVALERLDARGRGVEVALEESF